MSVPLIDAVNQYNDQQCERHKSEAGATPEPPLSRPAEINALVSSGVLRPVPLDTRGIRVFITFDHPRQPFRPETRSLEVRAVKRKCDEVRRSWEGRKEKTGEAIAPPNISIYAGAGSMTDFLVMARAPHKHFHAFVRQLIYGLREIGLAERYEMRPYTHVIADRMFTDCREHRRGRTRRRGHRQARPQRRGRVTRAQGHRGDELQEPDRRRPP